MPTTDRLDPALIFAALGDRASRFGLDIRDACDSTNSELRDHPPFDDGRIHVLACEAQSGGRGRRGRRWVSSAGAGLTFSMLWRFDAGAPVPGGLSLVAGLAVARCLERLGVEGVQLKWPNDVLVLGRKIAGILVELVPGRGRTLSAVVGIGVNVQAPDRAQLPPGVEACGLAEALPGAPQRNALLAALLRALEATFDRYATTGFPAFREAWLQRHAHAGLPVSITGETEDLVGTCVGVDDDGALLLATERGERRVLAGEVSLRPQA